MSPSILLAALLLLFQTPQASPEADANVFTDLGANHCATEVTVAVFENTEAAELAAADAPALVTYSAFTFESADHAQAALDEAHIQVARTFADDPDIAEHEDFDDLVTEVETEDRGDGTSAYVMNLPQENADLDVLQVNMLGIVKESQMVLILMFGTGGGEDASPGLSSDAILPFADMIDESWDGTGDIGDAIPAASEMPVGWEGQETTIEPSGEACN